MLSSYGLLFSLLLFYQRFTYYRIMFNRITFAGCHKNEESLSSPFDSNQEPSSSRCWILVQSNDGSDKQFFNRDWNSYRDGFGDASGNFWIGNEHLYQLTQVFNQGWYDSAVLHRNFVRCVDSIDSASLFSYEYVRNVWDIFSFLDTIAVQCLRNTARRCSLYDAVVM